MSFGITAGPDGNIWFTERFGGIEKISGMQLAAPAAVHLRKRKTGN
jgi:streptogramin lyase